MILINGKRDASTENYPPLEKNANAGVVNSFEELEKRVNDVLYAAKEVPPIRLALRYKLENPIMEEWMFDEMLEQVIAITLEQGYNPYQQADRIIPYMHGPKKHDPAREADLIMELKATELFETPMVRSINRPMIEVESMELEEEVPMTLLTLILYLEEWYGTI